MKVYIIFKVVANADDEYYTDTRIVRIFKREKDAQRYLIENKDILTFHSSYEYIKNVEPWIKEFDVE